MSRLILAGVAAAGLAIASFSGTAQAQCAWTGGYWSCAPAVYGYAPAYPHAYGNTYPAYNQPDFGWGYKPQWAPSIAGPRPSSGAGH